MLDNLIDEVRDLLDRYTSDESGEHSRDKYEEIKDNDLDILSLIYNTINFNDDDIVDLEDLRDNFETNIIINFDYNNY